MQDDQEGGTIQVEEVGGGGKNGPRNNKMGRYEGPKETIIACWW